jgi:hypothetical protein
MIKQIVTEMRWNDVMLIRYRYIVFLTYDIDILLLNPFQIIVCLTFLTQSLTTRLIQCPKYFFFLWLALLTIFFSRMT